MAEMAAYLPASGYANVNKRRLYDPLLSIKEFFEDSCEKVGFIGTLDDIKGQILPQGFFHSSCKDRKRTSIKGLSKKAFSTSLLGKNLARQRNESNWL